MVSLLLAELRHKLAKLIRLLSSTNDAEVLLASRAIIRTLENDGLDIHDLADMILTSPSPSCQSTKERIHEKDVAVDGEAHEYVVRNSLLVSCSLCFQNKRALTDAELEFIRYFEKQLILEKPFTRAEADRLNRISARFTWRAP